MDWQAAEEASSDPINKKRPRHSWTRQDRLLLCLLYRIYDNTAREYAAVFSYLCKDSLEREGFANSLPSTSLSSQFHDMAIGSNGHDLWHSIHIEQSLAECCLRHANVRREIEDTANVLGLELHLRVESPEFSANQCHLLAKRAQAAQHIRGVLSDVMPAVEETEPKEERPRNATAQPNIELPTSVSAAASGETPVATHVAFTPRLLFRFSNTKSAAKGPFLKDSKGFIAGSFVDNPSTISPVPTELLGALALIHLSPDQRLSHTPFISFFSSILPSFQRALRSSSKSYVTIINAKIAEECLKKRFNDGKEVIYSVYKLVSEFGLKLRNNYTGPTEFLIYGVVPSEAIVGILNINDIVESSINNCDFNDVLQLEVIKRAKYAGGLGSKLKRSTPPLLFATGQVVGRLLSLGNVPAEYIEVLAWKIACSWKFTGYEAGKKSGRYDDYMNGVHSACGRGRQISTNSEDQDEEDQDEDEQSEEDQELLDKGDDDAEYSSDPGCLKAFDHFDSAKLPVPTPTPTGLFEDDQYLIDRQFEADCPELGANYRHTFDEGEPENAPSQSSDVGDTTAESPAGEGISDPRMAHVRDWGGSPWRSITPLRPRGASQIAIVTGENGFFIDLTGDTEEEDINDAGSM